MSIEIVTPENVAAPMVWDMTKCEHGMPIMQIWANAERANGDTGANALEFDGWPESTEDRLAILEKSTATRRT